MKRMGTVDHEEARPSCDRTSYSRREGIKISLLLPFTAN